jgi:hypothetical protein
MGKSPKVKLEFGTLTMGESPGNKIYFELLNPKRPQWAPKMGTSPGVKFEFGRLPKTKSAPE